MTTFYIQNISMGKDSFEVLLNTLTRRFGERGCELCNAQDADYTFRLAKDPELSSDRYIIVPDGKEISFTAANDCALHAAVGRFLYDSRFDGIGGFEPSAEKVDFTPAKPLRGMYFATHFHNFYHEAPVSEVYEVIEDLALRGCNALLVWYDMHHYTSIDQPESVALISRLKLFLKYAKKIGMSASLTMLANEGFDSSPEQLRATFLVENGYHTKPYGIYNREICPSKPGGIEEILRERRQVLEAFSDVNIDFVCYWPYDQGGCTCEKCTPWGSNGFLRILPHFQKLLAEVCPGCKLIISAWYFDRFIDGEWEAFMKKIRSGEVSGFDYIMSFFFNGELPECIRRDGIPEGVRFIDFPEISMYSCTPWGGFGANPLGRFLDRTNMGSGHLYRGGFPYSEGIFEDINKYMILSYYSGRHLISHDAVKQYARFELCCDDTALVDAIERTETALARKGSIADGVRRLQIADTSDIEYVYNTLTEYDGRLPERIRRTPRWRMLYLRAVIDHELAANGFALSNSKRGTEALRELYGIYHCTPQTHHWVCPPLEQKT